MKDKKAYFYTSGPERHNGLAHHIHQVLLRGEVTTKEELLREGQRVNTMLEAVHAIP
jgi:hypothetical protein